MEKAFEFYITWLKSQQVFLESCFRCQKEFMENWINGINGIKNTQIFLGMVSPQGLTQQFSDIYNSWVSMMTNSSKIFTEGITKFQNISKTMTEKQEKMGEKTS